MKRHALFVGVDQYADKTIQDLHCAVNDATELAGFFKYRARFDRAEALPDPRNCEAVLERVHEMLDGLGAGDEFLFFFAGHGVKTPDGHRLVCAGDKLASVKHMWAGLPLERLKFETAGAFDRLFVLDACRTDILATNRGAAGVMENGTRDLIMEVAGPADAETGALTILCSCDDGECSGEILPLRHGLFSKAMLELLDEENRQGRKVLVTDDFAYKQIPNRMRRLAESSDMAFKQNPQKNGPPILILDGAAAAPTPTYVACPECGNYNLITETFKCKVCGRDHLCEKHRDSTTNCCAECADRRVRQRAAEEAARKAGALRTLTLPGGVEMRFRWCPPGTFMMGSPASEEGRNDNETQHRVTLTRGFWMGETPVTQEQWDGVMGSNPSCFKGVNLPVECVSWEECREFIRKVNAALDCGARFPTEAEWEYACRAGSETAYHWGDALNGDRANCDGNYPCGTAKKGPYLERTTSVGRYGANAWGLCDMHGNVLEWCSDWYGEYPSGSVTDPTGPSSGSYRVLRGGCWSYDAWYCRSASRSRDYPDCRSNYFGLRLLCSAGPHE